MNINISSPIGGTGYGIAGLNIVKALVKQDCKVALFPTGQPYLDSQKDLDVIQAAINCQADFDYKAPCLKIWHQFDLAQRVGGGEYVAFPFFELNEFNEREIHHIKFPDRVYVTSHWAKRIVAKYRDENTIVVVPLGVDTTIFTPQKSHRRTNSFVVANFGKWEKRKGHDVLVEIFNKAFSPSDNVELWLFPNNPFLTEAQIKEWESLYMQSALGHRVRIHPRIPTHEHLRDYMAISNVGIFPSRGEGWNLELLEMMAMGKLVLTTNYSAHTEYCTRNNSILVDVPSIEPARDGRWFFGDGTWGHLGNTEIDAFVEALRAVYKNWKANPTSVENLNGVETANRLTWDNTASIIKQDLLGR